MSSAFLAINFALLASLLIKETTTATLIPKNSNNNLSAAEIDDALAQSQSQLPSLPSSTSSPF